MKVTKFGGSSCAAASQFSKVKAIIEADSERKIVVVSAPGKRDDTDHKITDMLYLCHQFMQIGIGGDEVYDSISERFLTIQNELDLKIDLTEELEETRKLLKSDVKVDFTVSRGEYFSAKLMASYLGCQFVDAAEIIRFNQNNQLDTVQTKQLIREKIKDDCFVIPGFYGAKANGEIVTFPRGGSDITGSILAAALGVDEYENWTDVSGFLAADPRIVDNPKPLRRVTYEELRELSYMGANVLHEESILPARQRNIPIHILNTNAPNDAGTLIVPRAKRQDEDFVVTGIAG